MQTARACGSAQRYGSPGCGTFCELPEKKEEDAADEGRDSMQVPQASLAVVLLPELLVLLLPPAVSGVADGTPWGRHTELQAEP